MYKLHIRDDSGETTVVPVTRDKITVGRQEGNTIRLTERNVSRVHARIVCKDSQVFVEDVSRYGTRVNGLRIKERKVVEPDDVILIGDYELKIEQDKQVVDTVPATPKAKSKKASKKKAAKVKKEAKEEAIEARMTAETTVEETIDVDSTSMINLNEIEKAAKDLASKKTRVVADVPTLVAVNTELAGQEFRLSGTELIVGRTDDNDVVVDHRSISRNHARIVNEKGRVTVFDLDSANGLKINDEFYKQSVLRRGDVIELGHVRMRFVESGETFVYREEDWAQTKAPSVSTPAASPAKGSKKIWIIAVLCLVCVGSVIAVVVTGGDTQIKKSDPAPKNAKEATPKDVAKGTSTQTADGATKTPPPEKEANAAHAKRLASTKALFAAEQWDDARTICKSVLLEDNSNEEAQTCVAKAETEAKVQAAYTKAKKRFGSKDYARAWQILEAMTTDVTESVYKAKFNSLRSAVLPNYVNKLVSSAKSALRKKRYGQAITLSGKALDIDPANTAAKLTKGKAIARKGTTAGVKVVKDDTKKPKGDTKKPKDDTKKPKDDTKKPGPPDVGEKMTWRDYYKKAARAGAGKLAVYQEAASKGFALAYYYIGRTYMVQSQKGAAIKAFKTFLRKKPGHPKAESVRDFIAQMGG